MAANGGLMAMLAALPSMPWDDTLKQAAQACGLPLDQFKYTTALLLGIPLGYFLRYSTRDPWKCSDSEKASAIATRHMLCAIIGLMEVVYVFGWETFHSFFSTSVAYILLLVAPRNKVHMWVTAWAMGYMSCAHIYRMIVDFGGWTIDFTTPQLLVTQKLMNIAFSLYDGSRDPKKLTDEQSKRKLTSCPSVMEMFGYVFCIHTLLAGPATDYNDYLTWIDGSKLAGKKPKPTRAILLRIAGAIGCAVAFSVVLPYCNVRKIDAHGDGSFLSTKSFLYVLLWNNFSFCLLRHRYYFAWVLGDAGCNAAGFGYNGEDKKGRQKWDGVLNVDYFAVEFPPNFRSAMNGWNKATSNWLRRCVYERVPANWRQTATFGMSAVWHGFYPGYYFTFISCALFNEVARLLRRHVRPLVIPENEVVALFHGGEKKTRTRTRDEDKGGGGTDLLRLQTISSLNYLATPFLLLTFEKSITYWSYWHFAPHFIALLLYLAVPVVFKQPKSAAKKTQ